MSEYETNSRAKRHEKQRKQKKKIMFFIGLGALFCVILFSLIAFGNNEKQETGEPEKSQAELALEHQEGSFEISDHKKADEVDKAEEEEQEETEDEEAVDVEKVDVDDPNVLKAYEGDWKPIGTTQNGEHTTNYDDESNDRKEIRQAVSDVTGIEEQNMVEHWVGNGGDQKVEATVSDQEQEHFFRVYLSWVNDQGWQVTRMELLKENPE